MNISSCHYFTLLPNKTMACPTQLCTCHIILLPVSLNWKAPRVTAALRVNESLSNLLSTVHKCYNIYGNGCRREIDVDIVGCQLLRGSHDRVQEIRSHDGILNSCSKVTQNYEYSTCFTSHGGGFSWHSLSRMKCR